MAISYRIVGFAESGGRSSVSGDDCCLHWERGEISFGLATAMDSFSVAE